MLIPVLSLILAGCVATPPRAVTAQTLSGDPRLPGDEIEPLCDAAQWDILRAKPYRAFVILDADIYMDGSVTVGRAQSSYPDATWVEPARALLKEVQLRVSSTGSHIPPAGEIFVIFYGQGEGNRRALIYARQRDDPLPGTYGKAQYIAVEKY